MKFSRTFTNKLVSYVDRYFTYDYRRLKREGETELSFDFIGYNFDAKTSVLISREKYGMYVVIHKDDTDIKRGFLTTYKEVADFKRMIRCLG